MDFAFNEFPNRYVSFLRKMRNKTTLTLSLEQSSYSWMLNEPPLMKDKIEEELVESKRQSRDEIKRD